jgi:hypothetical protein
VFGALMARRNYHAEEQRRNELARARGFTSRAQQRRRIERGDIQALAPKRVKSPKTIAAQRSWSERAQALIKGLDLTKPSDFDRCADWSAAHAQTKQARFNPKHLPKGITLDDYVTAYMRAFVEGPGSYGLSRGSRQTTTNGYQYTGGSADLYYWFVILMGYYQADEYDEHYAIGG